MANKKIDKIIEDDIIEESSNVEDEVTEEEVQAVVNAIVDEAEENDKSVEDVINEIVEESKEIEKSSKKSKKDLDELVKGRGFSSYKEAVEFAEAEAFGRLHPFDQEEFNNWLKNIK